MTPREEKLMLRDIHRITLALESISKSIKAPIDVIMGEAEKTDEEQRLYSKNIERGEYKNIEWIEETRE